MTTTLKPRSVADRLRIGQFRAACDLHVTAGAIDVPQLDGVLDPVGGELHPDLTRPGLGLEFPRSDAAELRVA
ncbi:MAG: hypothetical protein H0W70_03105 [Actinobacteria bacterium]|nr:hypothetical protein [Actinomycetota bacterium]